MINRGFEMRKLVCFRLKVGTETVQDFVNQLVATFENIHFCHFCMTSPCLESSQLTLFLDSTIFLNSDRIDAVLEMFRAVRQVAASSNWCFNKSKKAGRQLKRSILALKQNVLFLLGTNIAMTYLKKNAKTKFQPIQ